MDNETARTSPWISWGFVTRPLPGEAVSGDSYIIKPTPSGVLIAVIDALGHGVEAAAVAKITAAVLNEYAAEAVTPLLKRCHKQLMGTRGVALSLAAFNGPERTVSWLGVGNVEGVLLRADPTTNAHRESLLTRGGVVGYRLPGLRDSVVPIKPGDRLVVTTDGIRSGFASDLIVSDQPQLMAERILSRFGKNTDDALVLVVRFPGSTS